MPLDRIRSLDAEVLVKSLGVGAFEPDFISLIKLTSNNFIICGLSTRIDVCAIGPAGA